MLDELTQLLIIIGITPEKRGFNYLNLVLEMLKEKQMPLKDIYYKISITEKVNVCTIDSSIRNAIISAHRSGKLIRLNKIFHCDIINASVSPTNKELIMTLYHYLNSKSPNGDDKSHFKIIF